jgi:aminopeptidase N
MPCNEHGFHGIHAVEAAYLHALRAPKDFATADAVEQFPPDVPVDWQELTLLVEVDVAAKHVWGTATYEGAVRRSNLQRLRFDAEGPVIQRAYDGQGRELTTDHDGKVLWLDLVQPVQRGDTVRVTMDFDTREPKSGFWFVLPDAEHPNRPAHAWTQGQDEDHKFWFPCHDSPNHKVRMHVIATVPDGQVALSNGALRDIYKAADPSKRIYDWQMSRPAPTYLLTLVVGPFVEVVQQREPVAVSYWTLPGREADGERAFGRTPQMLALYEKLLGVRYPFEKYSQVAVSEFIFGGMENSSMTTQTDLTLHDARAHLDFSSEPLVSHELAHQWFGDLVTCRTWSHGWLNEGFATYFEQLWREESETADEFDYGRLQAQRGYLAEDSGHYRRTIVTNKYEAPIDVFDAHLYEKGGAVLHMLRRHLGDAAFFQGLGSYLNQHADGNVETPDLRRALERYSGRDLGRFFSQWVEVGKGHPELKVTQSWNGDEKMLQVTIEQTQDTAFAPLFELTVAIDLHFADGVTQTRTMKVDKKQQSAWIACAVAPDMLLVDARGDLMATWELSVGEPLLRMALAKAPHAIARLRAAEALGKRPTAQNTDALGTALAGDPAWCVQAEVAKVLGKIGSNRAFGHLKAAVDTAHPKARRAVRSALGRFQNQEAAELLAHKLKDGDASYFVEADTALALGQTRQKLAFEALQHCLDRVGWNETVRVGVLEGLAALGDAQAIAVIAPFLGKQHDILLRCGAVRALCKFVAEPARVLDALAPWTTDTAFRLGMALGAALPGLGDARAIALLREVAERAVDDRVIKRAKEGIATVRSGLAAGGQLEGLRGDVDGLRADWRVLSERLEREVARHTKQGETA